MLLRLDCRRIDRGSHSQANTQESFKMSPATEVFRPPFTQAVRRALQGKTDARLADDLLFFEAWEIHPSSHLGATLRASQIRRANPGLAAEIDAELKKRPVRPSTPRKVPQDVD